MDHAGGRFGWTVALLADWLCAAPASGESLAPSAVRALVVTGGHDYDTDFYTLFEGDWVTWSHAVSSREAYARDIRDRYDVLVLYDMTRDLGETEQRNLLNFVESGIGMVYIQLGHDRQAHRHPGYRELVKRAILWSAGRLE